MIVSAEIQVRALCNGALILFSRFQVLEGQNGDDMKKWDFQGELGNPSTEYHKKICTLFQNEQAARNLKKIIWDFVKNLNIRPSHGALNYEAALQASQHSDKIGNQYLLEYSSKTFEGMGETLWPFVGGTSDLPMVP